MSFFLGSYFQKQSTGREEFVGLRVEGEWRAGDTIDHDDWELRGRRGHARTRHVPLVPPLLDFNGARPGARPSGSSLDGLTSGGSLSGLGLLFGSVDSREGLRGLGGGVVVLLVLGLLTTLGDGLGLWSGGGRGLLALSGLAGAAEDAANLGGRRLGLGLTLSLLTLGVLLLLGAKVSEERSAALLLESGGSGGLGGSSTITGGSSLVGLLVLGLFLSLLLLW